MSKNTYRKGITLIETLLVCLITGLLAFSASQILAGSYEAQIGYNKNIRAKQHKNSISERISSRVKEAAKAYYSPLTISVSFKDTIYDVLPENNSLAVMIPKFDLNGEVIKPSSGVTTFIGVAFSIIPDPDKQDGTYILIETNAEFDLATSLSDPFVINQSLPESWEAGESYVISDNLMPATFSNLGTDAFDVEGDMVNFAFAPINGNIYFPSDSGSISVNDGEYITRCQFRNFRI
ncbi:MAG TPA: hypothetical protein P5556_04745 [Candidatus Gastranaerophilales bacterium]|nr:hypothetical protein [Candidatus Gastranaerophilales bacterium]